MKLSASLLMIAISSCALLPDSRKEFKKWLSKPMNLQIKPFVSDGCSFWPEGTQNDKTKWIKCCIIHDIAYWRGGTENEKVKADNELHSCVEKVQGEIIAEMMLQGVKIGGSPRFVTSFRWAYGWNYTRGFTKLNKKEKAYITSITPKPGQDLRLYLDKSKIDPEIEKVGKQIY